MSDCIITVKNLQDTSRISYDPALSSNATQSRKKRSKVVDYFSYSPMAALKLCRDYKREKLDIDMVLVFQSESDGLSLFNAKSLKAMCRLADDLVKPLACSRYREFCCDWSVGKYVALLNNHTSCQDITDEDVRTTMTLIRNCSLYFKKKELKANCTYPDVSINQIKSPDCESVPPQCIKDNAVYNILKYLTDNAFMAESGDFLKYAAVLPGISMWRDDFFEEIYRTKLASSLPSADGVKLVGYKLGNVKFDEFNKQLLVDAVFIGIALVFVLLIMWLFLKSFLLALAAIFCIIFALVYAYFFYKIVFGITFFPFLNILAAVFLVGIGADDAFVYYDIWLQMRSAHPEANVMELTFHTLRYAALSMLVTSLTTSAAFFAGLSSSITSIKCFGIFAGMSILTNYLLMITWYPACVALHERWILKRVVDQRERHHTPQTREAEDEAAVESSDYLPCWSKFIDFPCGLCSGLIPFFQKLSKKVFEKWLPAVVLKLYWVWLILFVGLTAGFLCVNFVKPGLQLPTSSEFQVFSSSHPLEQYNLHYKSHFRFESQSDGAGMTIRLIWGIKKADNGDHLDPDSLGTIEMDDSFHGIFSKESQKWLLSLCNSIRQQEFYTKLQGDFCVMEEFQRVCEADFGQGPCCGNYSFPYPSEVAEKCLIKMQKSRPSFQGVLFERNSITPVGLMLVFPTKRYYTQAYEPMDKFWKEVNSWADKKMSKAPSGLKKGWVSTYWPDILDFFSLQEGLSKGTFSSLGISVLIAFCIMLLTTLNIFISIYAILTIVGIIAITIGSLVLDGWQLNVLESIVLSVSVGLSIDFTMHFGVAYRLSPDKSSRSTRVRYALVHIGSAVSMAALTTFITGKGNFISINFPVDIRGRRTCSHHFFPSLPSPSPLRESVCFISPCLSN